MTDRDRVIDITRRAMDAIRRVAGVPDDLPCGLVQVAAGGQYSHGWELAAPGVFYEFRGGYRLRPGARRRWRLDVRVTSQRHGGRDPKGVFAPLAWCANAQEALEVIADFLRGVDPCA